MHMEKKIRIKWQKKQKLNLLFISKIKNKNPKSFSLCQLYSESGSGTHTQSHGYTAKVPSCWPFHRKGKKRVFREIFSDSFERENYIFLVVQWWPESGVINKILVSDHSIRQLVDRQTVGKREEKVLLQGVLSFYSYQK